MAPEYAMTRQFSVKSDVFSFGVLILEIVSGRKITCLHNEEDREYLLSYREYEYSKLHFHYFEKINDKLRCRKISSLTWYMHIGILLQAWKKLDGGDGYKSHRSYIEG